jgi:hypothetical protein
VYILTINVNVKMQDVNDMQAIEYTSDPNKAVRNNRAQALSTRQAVTFKSVPI